MWRLVIIASFTISRVYGQNSRRPETYDNGHGWDIRLAVPGEPGGDYPTLNSIPRTAFSCSGKTPGYYADTETSCQVFRVCTLGSTYGFQSFLCPNGTLFNQAVFVCDWWMNVNCERSRLLFNSNNEQFGNLKLGPQLMKDIKKMLTHPMRTPYDKSIMKSNLIVMQDYRPPSGQLFPNGALIAGPERSPNNIYVPTKQKQATFNQNSYNAGDFSFAASTPSSQYIPSPFNGIQSNQGEKDFFQRQIQHQQFVQNGQTGTFSNGHAGELTRIKNSEYFNSNRILPTYIQKPDQSQKNIQKTQSIPINFVNQSQRQTAPYINKTPSNSVSNTVKEFGNSDTKQQYNNAKQNNQVAQKITQPQFFRGPNAGREAKQNLVSPNTVVPTGKTLKFSRIVQKSSAGNPKSRITFKTWIVRPSKAARQLIEPTPYSYDKPSDSLNENILIDTPTLDETPTTERVEDDQGEPYVYNPPTPAAKQVVTTIRETPQLYLPPTTPDSNLPNRRASTSRPPEPTRQSILNLAPTTYKPASRFYVPPLDNNLKVSRQYISPNPPTPQTINYQSARLVANPTSPAFDRTTAISANKNTPSFSLTKQSLINTNHNNLTFADILTKEKLDITVNDIVKNTNEILRTASPEKNNQYRQNIVAVDNNYVTPELQNESDEKLTPQPPLTISKSERIIATPSTNLEPPVQTSSNVYQNFNKISNLPFFKEPAIPTNTIERTVSLKITIPETIAEYLFTNRSDSNDLEILNTGSSNYLVLANNHLNDHNNGGLIPIGKLTWDKDVNNLNSQALVYSFLADSINAAKQYNNIAKQNVISSTPSATHSQFQNLNNEDAGIITDKISQLTSSQYANNNQKSANLVSLPQKTKNNGEFYRDTTKYTTNLSQTQSTLNHQAQISPVQLYSPPSQNTYNNKLVSNVQRNSNQIYSGQLYKLPVPEVTRQIYNSPNPAQSVNARRETNEASTRYSQPDINQIKQSNAEVEVLRSQTLPYAPARLQYTPTVESPQNHNSDNIFVNNFFDSNTGITAELQDKITGTLPHPLEENKLVTYNKDKSYYLYTKLEDNGNDNAQNTNTITQSNAQSNTQNAKLIQKNDLSNIQRVTFELFPSIGYEIEDEREKQQILNALKINEFSSKQAGSELNGKIESYNQRQDDIAANIDYTILHPTSNRQGENFNNANTILYRGPSSYLAPQSSVGSLGANQQRKSNANSRLEQFEDTNNNGYSKVIPAQRFSF